MITKEQWQQIEKELVNIYGRVELRCDGHTVSATVSQIDGLRFGIVIYVDGVLKGAYLNAENELGNKFYRPQKRYLCSAKERQLAKQKLGKRNLSEPIRNYYQRVLAAQITSIWYYWNDPKSFSRHIRKTCTEIELVRVGYSEG